MGATASRSSPPPTTTTRIVTIPDYSNLVRVPVPGPLTFGIISFRDLWWNVEVYPRCFNEGVADVLVVSVVIDLSEHGIYCGAGTHISIEILDETGEGTVFHKEGTLEAEGCLHELMLQGKTYMTILVLKRRELEASSCLRYDSFAVRCTLSFVDMKKRPTKRRLGSFTKSRKPAVILAPQGAMAGSHTLSIASLSKLKAALRNEECAHSTHFAVGGSRWFLKLCPNGHRNFLSIVRAGCDETPTTAEFSFEFQGVVNFKTQKMTHTFDRAKAEHVFQYQLLEPSTSDRLMVRCCLAVMLPAAILPPPCRAPN